ncbi:hypothetical protein NP233_g1551 [Leucocoprinus birnbaumii]|uniref:Uncharacterized protein n=1 Tax=Leucocoprinus birnbaumii TaxID=56174 RepID=A0AAD5YVQ3_9AGAR|nr:hypothetical protein NP233_g1551 [Leucocoprinus birnbaumii]
MTEYDYSPDAYERYLATQRRITRWAEDASRHSPSNPFVASPAEEKSTYSAISRGSASPERSHSKARQRSTSDVIQHRPQPSRSYTAPAPSQTQRSSAERSHSRSANHSHRPSRSSSSRHTCGSNHSRATNSTFKTVTLSADGPTHIKRSKSQSILVPVDGGRYIIVPAKGTRLEVVVSTCLLLLSILAWWITDTV